MNEMEPWVNWNEDGQAWPVPLAGRNKWAKDQLDPDYKLDGTLVHGYEAVASLSMSGDSLVVTLKWPGGLIEQYDCKITRLRDNGGLHG